MLNRYVNVNGYSFVSLMPEIIFYIRFAELCDKMKKKNLPLCKAEVLPKEDRNCCLRDVYNLKLGIKSAMVRIWILSQTILILTMTGEFTF